MRDVSSTRNVFAVSALFVAALGPALLGCSSESAPVEERQNVLQGELRRVVIGDYERGIALYQYFVELPDQRWVELVTDSVQEEAINRQVVVHGQALATGRFRVDSIDLPEPKNDGVGQVSEAVIAASPKKVAVILANFKNDASQPIDQAAARDRVFTGTSSSNAYFKEISYGVRSLVGVTNVNGDVFGWYTLDVSNTPCDYSAWGTKARSAAQAAGVNISAYDHIVHYFPRTSSCQLLGRRPATRTLQLDQRQQLTDDRSRARSQLRRSPRELVPLHVWRGQRPDQLELHLQRIRRSVRRDGQRLSPHERLPERAAGVARSRQHRDRHRGR